MAKRFDPDHSDYRDHPTGPPAGFGPPSPTTAAPPPETTSTQTSTQGKAYFFADYGSSTWSNPSGSRPTSNSTATSFAYTSSSIDPASQATASPEPAEKSHSNGDHDPHLPIGVMVLIPLAIIAMAIAAFIFWRRRRNAMKRAGGLPTQEMKIRSGEEGLLRGPPGYTESTSGFSMPVSATSAGALAVPAPTTASASRAPTQPVILNTNMGSAYFTGLDTSDAVSLTSNPNANRPSVDGRSINSDEPPPPYRPASVPPISRETSVRNPNGNHLSIDTALATLSERAFGRPASGRGDESDDDEATPTADTPMRNPFDDPDDDVASDTSTPVQSPFLSAQDGTIGRFSFESEHRS